MKDNPELSIVIPAYNEAVRIGPTLEAIESFFEANRISHEIIVVSDGSVDSTEEVVSTYVLRNERIRLIAYQPNRGKGFAVRTGAVQAKAKAVLITDADLATPIEEYWKLQEAVGNGCEIAIGSRALPKSEILGWRPWYRELSGKVFNKVVRALSVPSIHDTQCGFKLFTSGSAGRIFPISRIDGFGFDVEALYLARKFGYSVVEAPVRWSNSPSTKVSVLKHTAPMLLEVMKIRLYDWKRQYDRPTRG